jgi:hypothetical protein
MRRMSFLQRIFAVMLYPLPQYRPNSISKISIRVVFCALSVLAIFYPGAVQGQSFTLSPGNSSSIQLNPVLAGAGIVEDTILLYSTATSDTVSISISGSSDIGLIDTVTFIIDTNDSSPYPYPLIVTFAPKSVEKDSSTLIFNFDGHSATLRLSAQGIAPTADSSKLTLSNTANEIIAMEYQKDSAVLHVLIQNDLSTDTISNISLANDTFFHILSAPQTPFSFQKNASFEITLSFNASGASTGFLKDELLLVGVPNDPIAPAIAIQGLYNPNDAVQTQPPTTIYFYLYPNPSNGPVTIHTENILQSHVTITDVLGRTLTEASFTGDWQWDRSRGNGIAPSGTYFVVVTGIGMNGEPVHEVKRLVIE